MARPRAPLATKSASRLHSPVWVGAQIGPIETQKVEGHKLACASTRLVMSAPKSLRPSFRSPPRHQSAPRRQLDREPPRSMTASCPTNRASACSQPGPAGGRSTRPIDARRKRLCGLSPASTECCSAKRSRPRARLFAKACELRPRAHWLKTKKPDFVRTRPMPRGRPGDLSLIGR